MHGPTVSDVLNAAGIWHEAPVPLRLIDLLNDLGFWQKAPVRLIDLLKDFGICQPVPPDTDLLNEILKFWQTLPVPVKAFGITVVVGVGSFTIASFFDWQPKQHFLQQPADNFLLPNNHQNDDGINLSDGEKCAAGLIAVNAGVFLLWQTKGLQPMMYRYFTTSYASESLFPTMILSAFSHRSLIHLGLNMHSLWRASQVTVDKCIGPARFVAFYLTAAAFSSFTFLVHQAAIGSPDRVLGFGASGALAALSTYTCCKIPDGARGKKTATCLVIGQVVYDLAGLIYGFKTFGMNVGHSAHLGGALFGVAYYCYESFTWPRQRNVNLMERPHVWRAGAGLELH